MDEIEIASEATLWEWLAVHHGRETGAWLVTWKAHVRERYVGREAVLDALVAWGWTDGRRKKVDADRVAQLISPRRQQVWAATYKARAARLIEEGRMQPPGQAAIDRARSAGTWDAMADVDALMVPDDLRAALDARAGAAAFFDGTAPSYRRNVLRWVAGAKRLETRAKRVETLAVHSAAGQKVPQF